MGISFTDFTGGSAKQNNFAINTGVSGNNVFTLDRAYDDGSYAITVTSGDTSFDIYAIGTDGSYVGYTNSNKINISDKFNKLVMLGLPNNDEIFFEYRGKVNVPLASGSVPAAGAYVSSVSVSSLEDIDDTTTITGGNFANDVEVYFIGQSNTETAAKNVVVASVNQLIVTRPDSFDPNDSPYTIKVVNPGIPTPDGSNLFRLNNSVTAGTIPSWTTGSSVYYQLSVNTSIELVASDTEISDIDYSVVSGTLPSGLSLDTETGAISGTFSGSANDGDSLNLTLRATDAGGNFVDKEISFVANGGPSWNTPSGALTNGEPNAPYSVILSATPGAANSELSYSLVGGSLPSGLSLNQNGSFSGSPSQLEAQTFTIRVEDAFGNYSERTFSITVLNPNFDVEYLVIAGGGAGGSSTTQGGAGGGGAGGYRSSISGESSGGGASAESPLTVSTLETYTVTVGAGGAGVRNYSLGGNGSDSVFYSITSIGGGGGGHGQNGVANSGSSGGSGGGAGHWNFNGTRAGGAGTANQGYSGGSISSNGTERSGGGGGGAGNPGNNASNIASGNGGNGLYSSVTGSSIIRAGGGGGNGNPSYLATGGLGGGGNGRGEQPATDGLDNYGAGGGGSWGLYRGGSGGSGVVILKYPSQYKVNAGSGLAATDYVVGAYRVTEFTAGTGNITFAEVTAPTSFNLDYLVIAGGGGGGAGNCPGGGGGGAGGYRTSYGTSGGNSSAESTLSLSTLTNYSVQVGAGGAGEIIDTGTNGFNGNSSSFAKILSVGGGGGAGSTGGCGYSHGYSGGSGGGGASQTSYSPGLGGPGIAGQGSSGGNGASNQASYSNGGGGGGAGGSGSSGSSGSGGPGGSGLASSITGSSITRAGGGGGNNSTGGAGGGGNANAAGGSNTGGGGGGGKFGGVNAGPGGSGVVIIRYPDTFTISGGAGLAYSTDSSSVPGIKITTFTAGIGTIAFS
jgi:hypothetical protein